MKDIQLDQFEGPLNLLLKLIEDQELDITQISLAEVADQYLKLLHTQESWSADELADFLVIAAKLVLLKSKVLLPSLQLTDEEEGDARELERQLKLLKSYLDASKHVEKLHDREEIARVRTRIPRIHVPDHFLPPPNLASSLLVSSFYDIIERLKPLLPHPTKLIEKAATLEQRIKDIHTHLIQRISSSFRSIVGKTESKMEVIVSFLALLELVKQRTVTVQQPQLFEDISIDKI